MDVEMKKIERSAQRLEAEVRRLRGLQGRNQPVGERDRRSEASQRAKAGDSFEDRSVGIGSALKWRSCGRAAVKETAMGVNEQKVVEVAGARTTGLMQALGQ